MSNVNKTTRAIIDLLEVQTKLEVEAEMGKYIPPKEAIALALKIKAARNYMQDTFLKAISILENGPEK